MDVDKQLAKHFDTLIRGFGSPSPEGVSVNNPGSVLDPATQAKLAQARAADTAAVNASRAQIATPEIAPTAQAKPGFGVRMASALNPNMGTLAKGAAKIGKGGLALAPVMGAISAMASSPQEVNNNIPAGQENSLGGRLWGNVLNFLDKTGAAASFGIAPRIGRVLAGGSFLEPDAKPAALAAPAPAATVATNGAPAEVAPAAVEPTAPAGQDAVTQAILAAINPKLPSGSAATTLVDPRTEQSGGYIEGPNGRVELPSGPVTTFGVRRPRLADNLDASIERNQARADQATRVESAKLGVSLIGAGKRSAEEMVAHGKLQAGAAWLKVHPNDYGGYAAILAGKDPRESVGTIAGATGSTGLVTRDNKVVMLDNNGNAVEKTVYRTPMQADVDKMVKNKADPTHKASFISHFGPDAYKTLIEKR